MKSYLFPKKYRRGSETLIFIDKEQSGYWQSKRDLYIKAWGKLYMMQSLQKCIAIESNSR